MLTQDLGTYGEKLASRYLTQKNYVIRAMNYRLGHLEIDLIASYNNKTIFVEVKTIFKQGNEQTQQLLGREKIKRLSRAIMIYSEEQRIDPETVEIEYLEIVIDRYRKIANIKHYFNIF
jgi:putative endonuclease